MPSNLIRGQGNKGSSCIYLQRMDACQHEKLVEESTVVFFPVKEQLSVCRVTLVMLELNK